MEAIEFLKEAQRMCNEYACCVGCPICGECVFDGIYAQSPERLGAIGATVEAWIEAHPIKTNAQKFEEVFGEIKIKDLVHVVCNCTSIDELTVEVNETNWWDEPYKEPEHE